METKEKGYSKRKGEDELMKRHIVNAYANLH